MTTLLKRMSNLVENFVLRESQVEGIVGILVFGSFVKGKVRVKSDLDLLVLMEDSEENSRINKRENGFLLEIYKWPIYLFYKTLLGERGDLFSNAFLFEVMRTGRILYDPERILQKIKRYAQTHKLPYSHMKSLIKKANKSLHLAQNLLKSGELEGAEIEIRKSSEEIARVMLLERDILKINPPKIYLPHLRNKEPEFYITFSEVHNLKKLNRNKIEVAIQIISGWCERVVKEARSISEKYGLKGLIINAQTELSNAQDCLENGDLEAATLQIRYSALFLMSFILRLHQDEFSEFPGRRSAELLNSKHPDGDIVRSVMNFSRNKNRLKKHVGILKEIVRKYRNVALS